MYANNLFAKRRPTGWAERRRHFRRLFEWARAKAVKNEIQSADSEKPKR